MDLSAEISGDAYSAVVIEDAGATVVIGQATTDVAAEAAPIITVELQEPSVIAGGGVAGDAALLGGQPPGYYLDADNINAGVLAPERGGTGGGTPAQARAALEVYSVDEVNSLLRQRLVKQYFFAGGM